VSSGVVKVSLIKLSGFCKWQDSEVRRDRGRPEHDLSSPNDSKQKLLTNPPELAHRLGKREKVEQIADDFWKRGLVDHLGRPWGKIIPTKGSEPLKPYGRFRQAVLWYHRAKTGCFAVIDL